VLLPSPEEERLGRVADGFMGMGNSTTAVKWAAPMTYLDRALA
jgi:hypothetical protein